jgi:LysM repeat protein
MGRTTICRSNAALMAAAAFLLCPTVRAQDTTQVDTTQAAPAAVQQGQVPASHTVVAGETLWSIAQLYFGDPLLWPEIYRLNTAVIEDPHWIYPGEQLVLAPMMGEPIAQGPVEPLPADTTAPVADTVRATPAAADTVAAAPIDTMPADTVPAVVEAPPPPPPPTEPYRTMFDQERTRTQQVQDVLRAYAEQPYRPVRRGEFYAAGWLTEDEQLPWGKVLGATASPSIPRVTQTTSALVGNEIAVEPPRDASYHVGDSLLLVRLDRELVSWGHVVVPVGIARVTSVQERQVLAQVVTQYARVRDGRLAIPLEPFKDPGHVRPAPVALGLEARIIAQRDLHEIVNSSEQLFIDKGRAEGVVAGDIFEVYQPASSNVGEGSEQVRVTMMIIHTREHSATGLVLNLTHPTVPAGMPARLIRKMPS